MYKRGIFFLLMPALIFAQERLEDEKADWLKGEGHWIGEVVKNGAEAGKELVDGNPGEGFISEVVKGAADWAAGKLSGLLKEEFNKLTDTTKTIDLGEVYDGKTKLELEMDKFLEEQNGPLFADPLLQEPVRFAEASNETIPTTKISEKYKNSNTTDYIRGATVAANGKFMKQSLSSIAHGGPVQEYIISTERISPLVSSAMKQVQTWANQLNAMSIMSNDLTALLGPGLIPKRERANAYMLEHGLAAQEEMDLVTARHYSIAGKIKHTKGLNKEYIGDVDVADEIIGEVQNKKLLKAITGTVVIKKDEVGILPSKYKEVIDCLYRGKTQEADPEKAKELLEWSRKNVFATLQAIQKKLQENEELQPEETKILDNGSLPVGQLLTLLTQYKGMGSQMAIDRIAGLISYDHAIAFVESEAKKIVDRAKALLAVQYSGYELMAYIDQIEGVLKEIVEMKNEQQRKLTAEHQALETLIAIDRSLKERETGI